MTHPAILPSSAQLALRRFLRRELPLYIIAYRNNGGGSALRHLAVSSHDAPICGDTKASGFRHPVMYHDYEFGGLRDCKLCREMVTAAKEEKNV